MSNKNGINGNGQNGSPCVKKVVLDGQAEMQGNQVVQNLMTHLDQKKLTCSTETKEEIQRFLTDSGFKKIAVRKTDWPSHKETDFFMEFSLDGSVVENKKITRTGLIYHLAAVTT